MFDASNFMRINRDDGVTVFWRPLVAFNMRAWMLRWFVEWVLFASTKGYEDKSTLSASTPIATLWPTDIPAEQSNSAGGSSADFWLSRLPNIAT